MGSCALVEQLNRLRKSSRESIDSDKTFDDFKKYMHVGRDVEDDLKKILREVNFSHRKTLVLLCGSAGDGKSHMLSYLKNNDEEHLLDGYQIHNDATQSSGPDKTAVDTLNQVLRDFSDDRMDQPGANLILAINLGVLNNFIESQYAENFRILHEYVDRYILSAKAVDNGNDPPGSFLALRHVSFADYQLYTITEKGADSKYIETLLQRVFSASKKNPFYLTYSHNCVECPLQKRCPVKYNFLFLQKDEVQKYITKLLVMTIIKKKEILTTRELLNFFYDISVPQDFNYSKFSKLTPNEGALLEKFLSGMTPSLLFDQSGLSMLMDHIRENDPLLYRDEKSDDSAVEYYVSSDVSQFVEAGVNGTCYNDYLLESEILAEVNANENMKGIIFSCLVRLNAMKSNALQDPIYNEFVKTLYYFNSGRKQQLGSLYNSVKQAFLQWCGTDGSKDSVHVCIGENNHNYSLFEKVEFKPDLSSTPMDKELHRFLPEIKVGFKKENDQGKPVPTLEIDFPLYKMIHKLNNGYIHTSDDESNFTDFINFIRRLLRAGNSDKEVFIVDHKGRKSLFRDTDFGYEFKVMK